ncbi:MAG: TspO/MBR family protein [Gemmatimonadota bacterium]|nr:TspO/MBR family protein [Gemmatimonadota bacterium]
MTSRNWGALALFVLAPLAVGFVSGTSTADGVRTWYQEIARPSFTPPDRVFGPVWTALYITMGVAAFLVWRTGPAQSGVRLAIAWFAAQLIANGAWSLIFFGMRNPGLAFVEIVVLLGMIIVTTRLFWLRSRVAGALMLPYVAWVSFATILNFSIWRLNA